MYKNRTKTDDVTAHLRCTKATLHRIFEGFFFPNLPNILGNNFFQYVLQSLVGSSRKVKVGESSPLIVQLLLAYINHVTPGSAL